MASEQDAMEVATNFYYHKDTDKFLAEAKEKGVVVHVAEEKKDEFVNYAVGGIVNVIRFCKPGKPVSVTIRPIV